MDKDSKRVKEKESVRQLMVDDVFRALVTQKNGREFLWWLLQIGGVGKQPFTQDALVTAFECGTLNVGQQILARLLELAPEGYIAILTEKNEDERRERELRAGIGGESVNDNSGDEDAGTASGDFVPGH